MNDVNFSEGCKFSADAVPYIYGELSASESSAFEAHLLDCGECTDEFATISNARYDVYEWKKLEFDPLATPVFEIPVEREIVLSTGVSWLDKFREAFGGLAFPGVALAGFAIVAVLGAVFIFSSEKVGDIAANVSNGAVVSIPPIAPPVVAVEPSSNDVKTEAPGREMVRPSVGPARAATRDSKRPAAKAIPVAQPRVSEVKQTSAKNLQTKPAPRLNEFVEDEDTSLRLAELFEDIETSD